MIRPAKFGDIPRLVDLVREMHARSVYADLTLDVKETKATLVQAIQRHGKATCVFVADAGGGVEGFIVGLTDRIHGIAVERYATDWLFYASPLAGARAAVGLLDAFLGWAETAPGVVMVRLGVSGDVLGDDWPRVGRLYERRGLRQDGAMYTRRMACRAS